MHSRAEFEKVKRNREKWVIWRSWFFELPSVERDKSVLRCHEEGDNAFGFSGDREKGAENAIDDVVCRFCNLTEMRQFCMRAHPSFHIFVKDREDQRG